MKFISPFIKVLKMSKFALFSAFLFLSHPSFSQPCPCNYSSTIGEAAKDIICYQYVRAYFEQWGENYGDAWVPLVSQHNDIRSLSASSVFTEAEGFYEVDCPEEASMIHYGSHVAVVLNDGCLVSKDDGIIEIQVHAAQYANQDPDFGTYYRYQNKNAGMVLDCFNTNVCDDPCWNAYDISGLVNSGYYSSTLSSSHSVPSYYTSVTLNQSNVTWTKISGNGNYSISNNGQNATLNLNTNEGLYFKLESECGDIHYVLFTRSNGSNYFNNPQNGGISIVQAFPNPFLNKISLTLDIKEYENDQNIQVKLIGSDGKLYLNEEVRPTAQNFVLNTSSISSGVYFVQITNSEGKTLAIKRMVKNN